MRNFFQRFSDLFALFGLAMVLFGVIGTASMFREVATMDEDVPHEGFLPMAVEEASWQSRTLLAPPASPRPTVVAAKPQAGVAARPTPTFFQPQADVFVTPEVVTLATPTEQVFSAYAPFIYSAEGQSAEAHVEPIPLTAGDVPPEQEQSSPELAVIEPASVATAIPTPEPTRPAPFTPDRLLIPSLGLDAPVLVVAPAQVTLRGRAFEQWTAPDEYAVGLHAGSARIGEVGNTVLNGHHNIHGSVFANLKDIQVGDSLFLTGEGQLAEYVVAQVLLLEERYAPLEQRTENARWILPSDDERLTLVTCWPPESNTHRLVVVTRPLFDALP